MYLRDEIRFNFISYKNTIDKQYPVQIVVNLCRDCYYKCHKLLGASKITNKCQYLQLLRHIFLTSY